jgi:hypothetical protein
MAKRLLREISGRFLMLALLFCEEPRQCDDIGIDGLGAQSGTLAFTMAISIRCCTHDCDFLQTLDCLEATVGPSEGLPVFCSRSTQ